MRRLRLSFLGLQLAIAATLIPGAAVLAQTPSQGCAPDPLSNLVTAVPEAGVIVLARVQAVEPATSVTLAPEAFLKGSAGAGALLLAAGPGAVSCAPASFAVGERVLVLLPRDDITVWPDVAHAYELANGSVLAKSSIDTVRREADVVASIRGITGQYAVPAASRSEGAGINWTGTILPVGAALAAILVISLFLMRIWHRIDPS